VRWVIYCPTCGFETTVTREDGESMGEAIERLGAAHDARDGHEVRGRRWRGRSSG
jgi:uncharacterized Zn finger protein (UPF0148 family)